MVAIVSDYSKEKITLAPILMIAATILGVFFLSIAISKYSSSSVIGLKSKEFERLATLIIEERSWDTNNINVFVEKWNHLDSNTIHAITAKDWYRHFQFLLNEMVTDQQNIKRQKNTPSNKRTRYSDSLATLANLVQKRKSTLVAINEENDYDNTVANSSGEANTLQALPPNISDNKSKDSVDPDIQDGISEVKSDITDLTNVRPIVQEDERSLIVATNSKKTPISSNKPFEATALDLNDVVTKFVEAYAAGDLKQFDSVFSKSAKTYDQKNLAGIKHDYSDLFSSTSNRNMIIKDLRWIVSKTQAIGLGDFSATISDAKSNTQKSEAGKVQIIAHMEDSKIKITHLYHTIENK